MKLFTVFIRMLFYKVTFLYYERKTKEEAVS